MQQIIFSVPQGHVAVLTRFGKFARILPPGLHTRIIFLEELYTVYNWGQIANKKGFFIELTEQMVDTSPKQCHSKDNVPVTIDASIYWKIVDVRRAVFEVDNLPVALIDTCLNALRSEIGKLSLEEILASRKELSEKVSISLLDVAAKWGVEISRVEIQELETSSETADAMRLEMAAERKKRAIILQAEGEAEARQKEADAIAYAKKKEADAEAYAIKVRAEAEAEYIKTLTTSLGAAEVGKIMMLDKTLSAYGTIAAKPGNKVFLPGNIQTIVTDVANTTK